MFQCATRYDRLFSGLVVPQSVWALPPAEGAEGITPDDVYYRGERDADFGEVLRRAANRKVVASPTGFPINQIPLATQVRRPAKWTRNAR